MADPIREAHARLEQALAGALERVTAIGTPAEIERLVSLIIKHKIVMELLLDKIESANIWSPGPSLETASQPLPSDTSNSIAGEAPLVPPETAPSDEPVTNAGAILAANGEFLGEQGSVEMSSNA